MNSALRFILIFLGVVAFNLKATAQLNSSYTDQFAKVDSLASENKNEEALSLIKRINIQAKKDNNTQVVIRSVM
ncbi:MAG: hypothetical protein EOO92_15220, partial [Pedobacter sp.]